jgi:glycosyltransferase involved in cell wall biosynthesis
MLDQVERSILAPSIIDSRVVPNGVDTDTFRTGSQSAARRNLGLPPDATIIMTAGNGVKSNVWKDYQTLHDALVFLDGAWKGRELLMLIVGESGQDCKIGRINVRNIPYQLNSTDMANYYRASNLYFHAARVESFGNVLIEARACGTPVIATAVGGIPEHIKSLTWSGMPSDVTGYGIDEATGILTPPGDGKAMGIAALQLLDHPDQCQTLSDNGVKDIERNFSVSVQAERFLNWYREILSTKTADRRSN